MSRSARLAALLSLLVPAAVLAQGSASPPAEAHPGSEDPMAGWSPR